MWSEYFFTENGRILADLTATPSTYFSSRPDTIKSRSILTSKRKKLDHFYSMLCLTTSVFFSVILQQRISFPCTVKTFRIKKAQSSHTVHYPPSYPTSAAVFQELANVRGVTPTPLPATLFLASLRALKSCKLRFKLGTSF